MGFIMKEETTFTEYARVPARRLYWSSIFGGTFFAFGIMMILSLFGLAVGAAIASPDGVTTGAKTWGGIWALVTLFFGFFAGGWMAARTCGTLTRSEGVLHAAVTWGLGSAAILYFGVNTTGRLGMIFASLSGTIGQISATPGTLENMTVTAATWALIGAICGLIGALVGGSAGSRAAVVIPGIRRAA